MIWRNRDLEKETLMASLALNLHAGSNQSYLIGQVERQIDVPKMAASRSLRVYATSEVVTTGLGTAHGITHHITYVPPYLSVALQCFPQILNLRINFTQKFVRL